MLVWYLADVPLVVGVSIIFPSMKTKKNTIFVAVSNQDHTMLPEVPGKCQILVLDWLLGQQIHIPRRFCRFPIKYTQLFSSI
jgi:hypothetical protein